MYPKQRMFNLILPAFLLLVIMEKEAAAFPSAPKANRIGSPQRPTILLMPPGRLVTRSIINNNVNKADQGSLSFRNNQQNFNLRVRRHHSSWETFPSFFTASSIGDDTISDDNDEDYVFITPTDMYTGDPNDHRYSASDWWANVKSLPRSTILRAIQGPVITVMVWSFLVSITHGLLRWFAPSAQHAMCISSKPHSFLVSALGLLLVFRTNSAYQRFAEGRSIWENILSLSRNISRLACLYEKDLGNERKIRVFRLLGAFPYLLHHHIQPQCLNPVEYRDLKGSRFAMELQECAIGECGDDGDGDLDAEAVYQKNGNVVAYLAQSFRNRFRFRSRNTVKLQQKKRRQRQSQEQQRQRRQGKAATSEVVDSVNCGKCMVDRRDLPWCLLPPSALWKCADSLNRPLWVCDRLAQEMADVKYSDNFTSRERLAFLSHIDKLSKSIGECERIHQTAVPLNYARHSLRSLTIWLFSLPFALVSEFGLLTAPVMGVISWLLFGVYQIGCSIEDPFQGSLRLSILCDAIYRDVMYDADMSNKRDSAFQLEAELYEWDLLGPIEESKMLLNSKPQPNGSSQMVAPTQEEPQHRNSSLSSSASSQPLVYFPDVDNDDNDDDDETTDDDTIPTIQPPSASDDDPMQPRP